MSKERRIANPRMISGQWIKTPSVEDITEQLNTVISERDALAAALKEIASISQYSKCGGAGSSVGIAHKCNRIATEALEVEKLIRSARKLLAIDLKRLGRAVKRTKSQS